MAMEDIELDVGGTKFKGVYIAVLLSFASTLGGGIWAASEFFSRLEAQEEAVEDALQNSTQIKMEFDAYRELVEEKFGTLKEQTVADIAEFDTVVSTLDQQLEDNDISGLQGKLAELGTNLQTILDRQRELLGLTERVVEVEKSVTEMQVVVTEAKNATANANEIKQQLAATRKEIEDLWKGMDYLSNPYGGQ